MAPLYVDPEEVVDRLVGLAAAAFAAREDDLHRLDLRRSLEPDWFQRPGMVGYAAYADRFAGTLAGVAERASYLTDLGVGYLHLMPLLTPRPAPNDGGYAVQDFRSVRSDLGTVDDLRALTTRLRGDGISLCLDLVLNHVAREHEWAVKARAGDATYRDYFLVYPDRSMPDAYERTLPEVFPDFAPGSFTWDDELDGLGVDDVQRLPVGRELGEPRRAVRVRRRDPRPGQPRRRGVPAGRDRVHLEAARHQLPEPARGARADPGAAHGRPDRLPRGGVQGRGDRRAAGPAGLPRAGRAPRQGQRPRLPQRADGADLVDARQPGRAARLPGAPAAAAGAVDDRLDHLRPLPRRHRLGDLRRGRRGGRAVRLRAPAVPVRLLRRRVPRLVGRRPGVPGEPGDRRPPDLRVARLAGRARAPGTPRRSAGSCWRTRSCSASAGCR